MNVQGFLENFRYVAEAPNGVGQLRELIYFLAVTGALCPQDSSDGDGPALLRAIEQEREARIKQSRFKRSPRLEALTAKYDENRPEIPASWTWTRLVDIGEIGPKNFCDDDLVGSFASMSAVSGMHGIAIQGEDRPWSGMKKGFTHFADNDVVVAKITPCFENGKAAVVSGLTNGFGAGTTELHVVRPLPGVDSKFIYLFLRSPYFRTNGIQHMTGTAGQKRLPSEYFATRPFPLPPTAEQGRIVAKVEALMALCENLETRQKNLERLNARLSPGSNARILEEPSRNNLDALFCGGTDLITSDVREAVVALAVQGRLVPQDLREEPAPVLLQRIFQRKKQISRLGPVHEDEKAFDIPEAWRWTRLGNIALGSDSGWSPKCENTRRSGTAWGVLKVSAVSRGSFLPDENKALPSHLEGRPQYEVKDGDFLISRANTSELVARSVVVRNPPPQLMMSDKIVRFNIAPEMDSDFVNLAHSSMWARQYYTRSATGTSSSMKNVSRATIANLPLAIPPLSEQRRIVARVDELMALIDKLKDQKCHKMRIAEAFARAAVSAITGTAGQDTKPMKAPNSKLVTRLQFDRTLNLKPGAAEPLAALLSSHDGGLSAKALWQRSGLAIDDFYQQLKTEMAAGWISEPEPAVVREVESD